MNVTDLFNSKPEQQFKKGITESRQWLKESSVNSPVSGAITRRILNQRTDLLKYGPVAVMAAIDDVADFVGDVEEIGSSDVSGWVAQVERMLKENPPEAFEVEEGFNGEYDDEAGMAQGNLYTIAKAAEGLLDTIDDRDNLPEWVQEKIAKVEGMMVGAWNYMQSQKAQGIDPKVDEAVTAGSPRVDSLVTDALKIMRGADVTDAIQALKTVLGDREFSSRRGHYNFYVRQLVDMYGQQGVAETRRMDSYEKDVHAGQQGFDRPADHRGLRQELAHERNNLQVTINGKPWKVIPGKGYADSQEERNHLRSMQSWAEKKSASTGKRWSVSLTGAEVSESQKKSNLDEVSTELLGRYKTAAAADAKKSDAGGNYARGDKRFAGINRATIKQFDNDLKKHGQQKTEGAPVTTTLGAIEPGGAVDNFKQQMANDTQVAFKKKMKGVAEGDLDERNMGQPRVAAQKPEILSAADDGKTITVRVRAPDGTTRSIANSNPAVIQQWLNVKYGLRLPANLARKFVGIPASMAEQELDEIDRRGLLKGLSVAEAERGRGRPTAGEWNQTPGKTGRVEKTSTGIRHHADPSRYGGTEPDRDDDRLLSKAQLYRLDKATEPEVDEGWKSRVAGAALAGAAALGAGGAHSRVTYDADGNQIGGLKPAATVTAPDNQKPAVQAPAGFSKEYLQKASDPNRLGRYMISVEKAQELLKQMDRKPSAVNEQSSTSSSDVESAVTRRILTQHTDLLMKYGPQKVMQAIEEVAYNVGDLDEIGTSDISSWVQQVKRILGAA